ncbi:MAG: hypothetical protein IJD10_04800 [Clostridia bacterium]|nr:hypothetical protein [Clostridia bacterium]
MKKLFLYRRLGCLALAKLCLLLLVGCHAPASGGAAIPEGSDDAVSSTEETPKTMDAVYRGVLGYGTDGVTAEGKDTFSYRFSVAGEDVIFSVDNGPLIDGAYGYAIQNRLQVGSSYRITVEKGRVIDAVPLSEGDISAVVPEASYLPGEKTLKNFLSAALAPMGSTLYVYGGGWNWQDDGASTACRTVGLSPAWSAFFEECDGSYTYRGVNADGVDLYPHGGWNEYYFAGLDCSGYVGWAVYNTLNTEDGGEGYVMSSTKMAATFAEKGWGSYDKGREALRPGDIVSIQGHVWICIGTCSDGSVVIAHSTPSDSREGQPGGGVQLSALGGDTACEAYRLADRYMSQYFPAWYQRYPVSLKSYDGYTNFTAEAAGRFGWHLGEGSLLSDPEGVASLQAAEVLALLFGEVS